MKCADCERKDVQEYRTGNRPDSIWLCDEHRDAHRRSGEYVWLANPPGRSEDTS